MKKFYLYNESQNGEITTYLAEEEERQQRSLNHLTPIVLDDLRTNLLLEAIECALDAYRTDLADSNYEDEDEDEDEIEYLKLAIKNLEDMFRMLNK